MIGQSVRHMHLKCSITDAKLYTQNNGADDENAFLVILLLKRGPKMVWAGCCDNPEFVMVLSAD